MATPRYRQQTTTPMPASDDRVRAANVDAGIARGLSAAGAGIQQLGHDVVDVRIREKQEAYDRAVRQELQFALTDSIRAETEWQSYIDESVQNAPANGSGLVEKFDKDFGEHMPKAMQAYKTEEGRQRAEVVYTRLRAVTRERLAAAQAGLLAKDSDRRRREALTDAERLVNLDPSRYGALEATVTTLVRELPGLTQDQRVAFEGEQRRSLAVAAGYGAVTQSPYAVLAELSKERPGVAWARHLEVDDVMRLRSAAQSEVNRLEAEQRARQIEARSVLQLDTADAFAARAAGLPAKLPDRSRFVAAFGKDGAAKYAEARDRWAIYDVVGEAAFLPREQAQATLARLKPASQEGAAAKSEVYEAAVRLYEQQRQALEADPVAVLAQRDPAVRAAREAAANDPAQVGRYFSTLRARQQAVGVEQPKLLPEAERTRLANALAFDPNAPQKRLQALATMRQAYGPDYGAVMQEVAPKLDGIGRVLVSMAPAEAERLDAAFAQREALQKSVPTKATRDVKAAIEGELADFMATLADSPDGPERFAEHLEAATLLAQSKVMAGASPEQAAQDAAESVINGQYTFRGMLRIPKPLNPDLVEGALQARRAELAKSGAFLVTPMKGSTPEEAQADMRNLVQRQAYWATSEDGTAAVLRVPHRFGLGDVYLETGQRVELPFADLEAWRPDAETFVWGGY